MFMIGFPAAAFATNCFVLAPAEGERALIIDPGIGVVDRLRTVLSEHRLKPAAVLLTHGHLDHVYSVTPVCTGSADEAMPAYIHTDDEYRLKNPLELVDPELMAMLQMQFGKLATWKEPEEVRTITDGQSLQLAGIDLSVLHAPGHTEGSVMFRVEDLPSQVGPDSGLTRTLFAGDVLFAGGIGRTDLPGGSDAAMRASLRDVVLSEQDDSLVLPGHGPATTIGRERVTNPYLVGL
ncbi:MAG: MBL fold metallo-hydrolase [Austwickia sp.]|nr:MBL fold metallo-hydrolase [Austwickia sp.]MBK8435227.1 MBL fold metallo-hydrolase [Austwickia sp.]